MKSILKYLFLAAAIFLLSGCSVKQQTKAYTTKDNEIPLEYFDKMVYDAHRAKLPTQEITESGYDVVTLITRSGYSNFNHILYNKSTRATLQQAARVTLFEKYKYFAFTHPKMISNFHGSLINTAEEYLEQCEINVGHVLVGGLNACQFNVKPNKTITQIIMLNNPPNDFLVYDAQQVINYLKSKDLFEDEIEITESRNISSQVKYSHIEDF